MKKVGIVNVTGYAGVELARILARHPEVELTQVTGRSQAGQRLAQVFPHLSALDMMIHEDIQDDVDVAFLALPHKAAAEQAPGLLDRGIKVIDISADFRLKDVAEYEQWYGVEHPSAGLLAEAVYGLPELNAKQIAEARLIANPGCYPTCSILGLAPALANGLIEPDIVIDAKSGVSGAGRSLSMTTHYSEVNDSVSAYGLKGHRHLPEIAQGLRNAAGAPDRPIDVTFVPHLIPMTRGILATSYAKLSAKGRDIVESAGKDAQGALARVWQEFYKNSYFVKVAEQPPATKQVYGSNYCFIYPTLDPRVGKLVVVSVIDNLVKGAAGEAVQNMNLMFGWPEETGLQGLPVYP